VAVDGRPSAYGGPEYETIAAFGSNCGIDDLPMINRANELCNQYMLDTISTGAVIAFAMECFEHGLIGLQDTDGIDLRFGNADALLPMIERIALRQGIGNLLAEGSKRAAQVIGGDAFQFTVEVKGQELAMHDPRGKFNVGMGYAISEIGADHLVVTHDPMLQNPDSGSFKSVRTLGITEAQPARSLNDEKVRQFYILEKWNSMEKSIGFCFFGPAPRSFIQPEDVLAAIHVASGWDMDMAELMRIGERGTILARAFNDREGFTRKDDTLPERIFQALENGALAGKAYPKEDFEQALTRLYTLKGWDPETGKPLRGRLEELSLGWAADVIETASQV
jgi:aldehyde:ferredoxin oxidoreductase